MSLWAGATVVVMPKFELEPYLALVERHRATLLHVVPPVVVAFAKHPLLAGRDFSFVRKLFSGAAPLGADVIEQCTRRLGCLVQQGYGMTEASPATHITTEDVARNKPGSIGRPVANTECRVVDAETGRDVGARHGRRDLGSRAAGHARLLQTARRDARPPSMPTAGCTRATSVTPTPTATSSSSIGSRSSSSTRACRLPPAELEAVLLSHPAMADAAVVPLADAECGEIPRAFVVLKGAATAEELMEHVAERSRPIKRCGASSSSTRFRSRRRARFCGACCGIGRLSRT